MMKNFIRSLRLEASIGEVKAYYARLPVVRQIAAEGGLDFDSPVTMFVGENGMGKSTLLEAVAVAYGFNPEGGSANFRFSTKDSHSGLHAHMRLVKDIRKPTDGFFLRAESFYNVASEVDSLYEDEEVPDFYGGKSLHAQSHGESFMALVQSRFRGGGLYLLDEPEAALSPARQLALLALLHALAGEGAQFIISTHSPLLMAYPEARIYALSEQGIARTAYRDTEHFQIMRQFMEDPERMLHYLFAE